MDDAEAAPELEKKPEAPKKGGGLVTALVSALVGGVIAGGIAVGVPRFLGDAHAAKPSAKDAPSAAPEAPPGGVVALEPIVVNLASKDDDEVHHLKVTLSLETPESGGHGAEDEMKKYMPRGREAAIRFLRAQTLERATNPKEYEKLTAELGERVKEAMGKERVTRVLVTDFVTQ
jgi:flagellar basal body-associated protein FliL